MLVKLAKARAAGTLGECADCAEAAGRKYIATASHLPRACLGGSACVPIEPVHGAPETIKPNGRTG